MEQLRGKIAAIRRRLWVFSCLDYTLLGWLLVAIALTVALIVSKFFPFSLPWGYVSLGAAGACVVIAIVVAIIRRRTLFEAALSADVELNLRERLSSVLALSEIHHQDGPAYQALEDDAVHYASAIHPSRDFRYRAPHYARHLIWPLMLFAIIWFLPAFPLMSEPPPPPPLKKSAVTAMTPEDRNKKAEEIRNLAQEIKKREVLETSEGTDLMMSDKLERLSEDISMGRLNEREIVAEMSRLNDDARLKEEDLRKAAQPFRQLQGMKTANQTQDLQKALKNQDFQKAAQQMQELMDKVQDNKLSDQEKQELAEEMKDLADQVQENKQLSDALNSAADALSQQGQQQQEQGDQSGEQGSGQQQADGAQQQGQQKDQQGQGQQDQGDQGNQSEQGQSQQQQQANEGQAGQEGQSQQQGQQQAAQQSDSQQGQQAGQQQSAGGQQANQQAAASMQQAQQAMQNMAQMQQQMAALSEMQQAMGESMSQSMSGQQQGQGQQPGGQQGQQQGQQSGGQSAMAQGGSGQGEGPSSGTNSQGDWSEGNSDMSSSGSGGPGRGQGGSPPDDGSMATGFKDVFIPGQQNEGEIIAVFEVDALVPKGESHVGYSNVPPELRQNAADTIRDVEIPLGYRNAVRDYFESINFQSDDQ